MNQHKIDTKKAGDAVRRAPARAWQFEGRAGEADDLNVWLEGQVSAYRFVQVKVGHNAPVMELGFVGSSSPSVTVGVGGWIVVEDGVAKGYNDATFAKRFEVQ